MHFSPKLLRDKIRGNEFWAKLAKNVFTIVVGQGGASAFNMLTSFVSAGFLGVAGYGSLMIGQTYMQAIDALLNFQSWQSVIRYGSICLEKRDDRGLAACIKAAFLVDVISAVAGCVISFAIVGFVASVLGWDSAATAAAVVFCFEILAHIEGAPTGLLRLFDRFNYVAIHAVVMAAVKLIFVAASMVLFGNNVVIIACAYCAADIIKSLTLFFIAVHVARRRVGLFKIVKARRVDLPAGYISFTIWSNLDTSADAPIQYFDVFFLSLLSSEVVGVFKFFRQLLSVLSLLSRPVQQAIMPQLAELIAKGLNNRAYEPALRRVLVSLCHISRSGRCEHCLFRYSSLLQRLWPNEAVDSHHAYLERCIPRCFLFATRKAWRDGNSACNGFAIFDCYRAEGHIHSEGHS